MFCTSIYGQSFKGYVRENDSLATPIYHASVEVRESGGHIVSSSKTYFDGSFKFDVVKDQNYSIHISVPGYVDTTYRVVTDKKGKPIRDSVTVRLKKDGMRLVGHVQGSDNLPIKNATLILKNVMTRKEDRQTTGNDGYFNFKLEYETNYRINIDKRSLGIINKYQDTTFYVSTVGFNKPLDYALDIILLPDEKQNTEIPEGYNAAEVKPTEAIKPVIAIKGNAEKQSTTASTSASTSKGSHTYTVAKAMDVQEEHKAAKDSVTLARFERDNNKPAPVSNPVAKAVVPKDEHKAAKDTMMLVRFDKENNKPAPATSPVAPKKEPESKTKADLAAVKSLESSLGQMQQEQKRLTREMNANKLAQDSLNRKLLAARQKMMEDSITEVQDRNRRIAQEVVAKRMYNDSVSRSKTIVQPAISSPATKTTAKDSIANVLWQRKQKLLRDSIQKAKAAGQ